MKKEPLRTQDNCRYTDVVIVGGGASALAAAVELRMSDPGTGVVIIEKNPAPARKIRATGSGRCNITNTSAEGYIDIMKFFTRIGLVTKAYGNGLVYPYSESAADVADLLTARAQELGACIITDAEVTRVRPASGPGNVRFETEYAGGRIRSEFVILACGGKAGPMFGTTGDGYRMARELGHSIVTPVPVLTPVECAEWDPHHRPCAVSLAGTRTRGVVTLCKCPAFGSGHGTEIFEEAGEIQFTRFGLSGICVFNMTRHMRYDRSKGESLSDFTVTADLYPDGDIKSFLRERRENAFPGEKAAGVLRTVLKDNIAEYVMRTVSAAGIQAADKLVSDLTDGDIEAVGNAVHCMEFHPEKLRGWKEAQASSGGVSMEEIDPDTSGSRILDGLYITGELADRDFQCGGFNLSNAWITGLAAAHSILQNVE